MDHLLEPVYYPSRSRVTGKYDENRVYEPDEVGVKTTIIKMLRAFGNLSFAPLCSYLQNHEDSHVHIRMAIYLEFMRLGEAAYPALVSAIEDPSTQIVLDILYFLKLINCHVTYLIVMNTLRSMPKDCPMQLSKN